MLVQQSTILLFSYSRNQSTGVAPVTWVAIQTLINQLHLQNLKARGDGVVDDIPVKSCSVLLPSRFGTLSAKAAYHPATINLVLLSYSCL